MDRLFDRELVKKQSINVKRRKKLMILLIQTWKLFSFEVLDFDRQAMVTKNLLEYLQLFFVFFCMHYLSQM